MIDINNLFMIYIDNEVGYMKPRGNNKVGYINQHGEVVIEPKFCHGGDFNEGVAEVSLESEGKFGFINTNGELVINCKFDWAYSFSEGLAPVQINEKWGCINRSGEIIIICFYFIMEGYQGILHF